MCFPFKKQTVSSRSWIPFILFSIATACFGIHYYSPEAFISISLYSKVYYSVCALYKEVQVFPTAPRVITLHSASNIKLNSKHNATLFICLPVVVLCLFVKVWTMNAGWTKLYRCYGSEAKFIALNPCYKSCINLLTLSVVDGFCRHQGTTLRVSRKHFL